MDSLPSQSPLQEGVRKVREGAVVAEAEVRAMGAKEHRKLPETGKGKQILPDSALEPPEEAARLTSCL